MKIVKIVLLTFIFSFGALTLFMSGSVIFDLFGIRNLEGNYVSFIVWINFIGSFMYFMAGYGIWKSQSWSVYVFGAIIVLLSIGYIGLLIHIYDGGLYEGKTVNAMLFRMVITLIVFFLSRYLLKKSIKSQKHE